MLQMQIFKNRYWMPMFGICEAHLIML